MAKTQNQNLGKYINFFTDFGFKKLFGEEVNKGLLIHFLNTLLDNTSKITDITYLKSEILGKQEKDRKSIFDLYCKNEKGEHIIIEMQKAKQKYFKDRGLFYASNIILSQAKKDKKAEVGSDEKDFVWNYQLENVYTISVMDFKFDVVGEESEGNEVKHDIMLLNVKTNKIFYDKLRFIYLEMPNFHKTVDQLKTNYDKWLFVLKNISQLQAIPKNLNKGIFMDIFQVAEIANYSSQEMMEYEDSLKSYRDLRNSILTSHDEGFEEGEVIGLQKGEILGLQKGEILGLQKGKIMGLQEVVLNMIKTGFDNISIQNATNFSISEIEKIRAELAKK